MRRTLLAVAAMAIGALSLVAAGCGGKDGGGPPGGPEPATSDTGAATLRANLTALLEDDVYLTGLATLTAVRDGFDAPTAQAARAAVTANARDIGRFAARIYGPSAADRVTASWTEHAGTLADYARGRAAQDEAAVSTAAESLDEDRGTIAGAFAALDPKLSARQVAGDLTEPFQRLADAVDAAVARSAKTAAKLKGAADATDDAAEDIAAAIAKQKPDRYDGSARSGAAGLRAGLTGLLVDHVHLTALLVDATVADGAGAPSARAAARALDESTTALSQAIASVYGEDAGDTLLDVWRARSDHLAAYTKAKLAKDDGAAEAALGDLDADTQALATLLANADSKLGKQAVAARFAAVTGAATAAIRARVSRSPKAFARVQDAAELMPPIASFLAQAITRQFPDRFPAD